MKRVWAAVAIVIALVVLCAALFVGWLVNDRTLPATPTDVTIPKGSGLAEIADQLESAGVIRSARVFRLYARAMRPELRAEAAAYTFPPHENLGGVADVLAAGGRPLVVWVTIPEGFTVREIAARLARAGLFDASAFERVALGSSIVLDGARTKNLEGFLFPDTYSLAHDAAPQTVAKIMTDQFLRELPRDHAAAARRLHFSEPQIIVIASLIEREAKVDGERALMAGVYYNRLRRGMPLEVDATIEYALPQHKTALSLSDLAIDSPYNTYRYPGLPPTPIANPGKRSIDAAFHPRASDYLYYVYMGHGRHKFSRTLEEQNAAEQQYLH